MLLQEMVAKYFLARSDLSVNTRAEYGNSFNHLVKFLGDERPFDSISAEDIDRFMDFLAHLRAKTRSNVHVSLSSLWSWAVKRGYVKSNIIALVQRPKYKRRQVAAYTEIEVKKMLESTAQSAPYTRPGKRECVHSLPDVTVYRDRAIIMALLDTGCRASELCNASFVDLRGNELLVCGKGDKERFVYISDSTRGALERYWAVLPKRRPESPFFETVAGERLDRLDMFRIIRRIANRAGVPKANCHRFRHTFAITFLRNGGDIINLKKLLGHSDMETVEIYLEISQSDIRNAHWRASPVKSWGIESEALSRSEPFQRQYVFPKSAKGGG